MPQLSFGEEDFGRQQRKTLKTRKRVFLEQMEQVVPWTELVALIAPHAPPNRRSEGKAGRPPFSVETMLRIHFLQQWFKAMVPSIGPGDGRGVARHGAISSFCGSGLEAGQHAR